MKIELEASSSFILVTFSNHSHDPGYEGDAAGDWVQDHGAGKAVGGAGFDVVELRAVGGGDDVGGRVADVPTGAVVW